MKILLTSAMAFGVVVTLGSIEPTQAATAYQQGSYQQVQLAPVRYYHSYRSYDPYVYDYGYQGYDYGYQGAPVVVEQPYSRGYYRSEPAIRVGPLSIF